MRGEDLLDEMFQDDLGNDFDVNFNFDGEYWIAVFIGQSSDYSIIARGTATTPEKALENLLWQK